MSKIDKDTAELAKNFKGRLPRGVRDEIVAHNRQKKLALKQNKDGTALQIPKTDLFFEEFLKNGGNATEAAMTVFGCPTREAAASLGHYYWKKLRLLGRVYLEQRGFSYGKILEVMAGKAIEARDPDWMDRLLRMLGYHDFMTKNAPTQTVNIIQTEKEIINKYIDGEIEDVTPSDTEEDENAPMAG